MMRLIYLLLLLVVGFAAHAANPPYHGTIFIESQLITADDPSLFAAIEARGHGMRRMFDRRDGGKFNVVDAWLFEASYSDQLRLEVQVNPEFDQQTAHKLAERFAKVLGQLPHCLRVDAETIWIHGGKQPFGGGNKNYLIHTGMAEEYERDGILEETLMHEGSHTSLDGRYADHSDWKQAQQLDGGFISEYAKENPRREDVAESFVPYLAVRYREARIRPENAEKIRATIQHRMEFFDKQNLDLRPFANNAK